jgi:hypothetical protein
LTNGAGVLAGFFWVALIESIFLRLIDFFKFMEKKRNKKMSLFKKIKSE